MKDIELSAYGQASASPAPVNQMMTEIACDFRDGIDINLGVGYVNEATIPREQIAGATGAVLDNPETYRLALNYGAAQGSNHLIAALNKLILNNRLGNLDEQTLAHNEIIIGPNGATSLLESIAHILPAGIVLTTEPCYYIYCNALARLGFDVRTVGEDDEGIDTGQLEKTLEALAGRQQQIAFIYLCTVNNPTCSILSNQRRRQLVDIVTRLSEKLGRKIPLFLDKAYEHLIHDPDIAELDSALLYDQIGIVYEIATLSKILAPALRIGYMIGPDNPFLQAMIQRSSDAGFSAPLLNQEIASLLIGQNFSDQLNRVNQAYRAKAEKVKRRLIDGLGSHIKQISGGKAGFYFYLTFKQLETHEASPLFQYMTRTTGDTAIDGPAGNKHPRALYIPGIHFARPGGAPSALSYRQCRISYGYEEPDALEKAIKLFARAAEYAEKKCGG